MPNSVSAVLVIVAFIMPGFVANRVFSFAHSSPETNEGRMLLGAITLSSVNYGVLSWLLVLAWTEKWYADPILLTLLVLFVLFVSPIAIALLLVKAIDAEWALHFRSIFRIAHPVPKAWDSFFRKGIPCWVVATLKGGRLVAGLYGGNSFASSFPAQEDIYLEKLCMLSPEGKMECVIDRSLGGIIRMENVEMLELFEI